MLRIIGTIVLWLGGRVGALLLLTVSWGGGRRGIVVIDCGYFPLLIFVDGVLVGRGVVDVLCVGVGRDWGWHCVLSAASPSAAGAGTRFCA